MSEPFGSQRFSPVLGPMLRRVFLILPSLCLVFCACHRHYVGDPVSGVGETPAKLLPGLGSLHHPITTTSPDAQKFFDQGLTLVYAFNFAEAVHSFRRAAEFDPKTPMPYWGIALALGPNYNASHMAPSREEPAYEAIRQAQRLSATAPANEREYVEALARNFTGAPGLEIEGSDRDYATAMHALSQRYPDDPDAATLYAEALMDLHPWRLWNVDGSPGEGTLEIVSLLQGVLKRWPAHVGANHLYIHALEGSPFPERALPSAHRLETFAPGAGHLVHMPAHIYFRTGDYASAVRSSLSAVLADREYARERTIMNSPYVMGYSCHNLYFLAASASMDGEFETAYKAAKELESHAHSQAFLVTTALVLLRFARWTDVLALSAPDAKFRGAVLFRRYARGCAFARTGQTQKAEDERAAMEQVYQRIPPGHAFGMFFNDWSTLYEIASDALRAQIAAAQGNKTAAIENWRRAVAVQDGMNFDDLPDWYYPVRESLGAALLRCGRTAQAEQVFRQDLLRNPRNPRSLFGLWKALEAEGRTVDADRAYQSFEHAWKGSRDQLRVEDF